jgi:hypothetical protein
MKMVLLRAMQLKRGSGYRNEFHCIEPELNISHLRFRTIIHTRTRYEKTCFLRKAVYWANTRGSCRLGQTSSVQYFKIWLRPRTKHVASSLPKTFVGLTWSETKQTRHRHCGLNGLPGQPQPICMHSTQLNGALRPNGSWCLVVPRRSSSDLHSRCWPSGPYVLIGRYQRFGETCYLCLQGLNPHDIATLTNTNRHENLKCHTFMDNTQWPIIRMFSILVYHYRLPTTNTSRHSQLTSPCWFHRVHSLLRITKYV